MANGNDRDIEFLAQQLEDLEEKAALLERQKEEAEELLERARNDDAAAEKAREELLEETSKAYLSLEAQLRDYVARYNEVSKKLEAAQQADDFRYNAQTYRTQRRLNEHYQKEIKSAKAEMRQLQATIDAERAATEAERQAAIAEREAATRELNLAREEVYQSQQECNAAIRSLNVYTRVFNDIIFPRFAEHYNALAGETPNSINPVKLQQAVACAKRRDAEYESALKQYYKDQRKGKQTPEPQRSAASYSSIVSGIVEEYLSLREEYSRTPIGKQKVDEFDRELDSTLKRRESLQTPELVIEKMLNDQSKTYVGSVAKTKKGVTLISTIGAVIVGLGILAGSIFGIYQATHKDLVDTTGALQDTTTQVQVLEDLQDKANDIITEGSIDGAYDTIGTHVSNTETIQLIFGTEEAAEVQSEKIGREVSTSSINGAVQKAQDAKAKADALYETKESVIKEFKTAVSEKDAEKINASAEKVKSLSENMQNIKSEAAAAVSEALDAVGMMDIQNVLSIVNNPYSSVEFGADAVAKYNDVLINQGKGGNLLNIVSNDYVKSTGDVTILAECEDAFGRNYYNLFEYQIAPNIHVLGEDQMMAPIVKGENVSMQSFDKDLVTDVEGQNTQMSTDKGEVTGTASIKYHITASYNDKKNQTVVNASALVTVTDADGKVSTKVINLTPEKFQGQVKVSDVEAQMKKEIVKKVNAVLDREVNLEVEDESVSEP